jgi:hypothetical protein
MYHNCVGGYTMNDKNSQNNKKKYLNESTILNPTDKRELTIKYSSILDQPDDRGKAQTALNYVDVKLK